MGFCSYHDCRIAGAQGRANEPAQAFKENSVFAVELDTVAARIGMPVGGWHRKQIRSEGSAHKHLWVAAKGRVGVGSNDEAPSLLD